MVGWGWVHGLREHDDIIATAPPLLSDDFSTGRRSRLSSLPSSARLCHVTCALILISCGPLFRGAPSHPEAHLQRVFLTALVS